MYDIPRGSVFDPLLFLIYINDMHTSTPKVSFHLFADNLFILLHQKPENIGNKSQCSPRQHLKLT